MLDGLEHGGYLVGGDIPGQFHDTFTFAVITIAGGNELDPGRNVVAGKGLGLAKSRRELW